MTVRPATDPRAWDEFLSRQRFRPFLQSWTMGEVFGDVGQEPIRLEVKDDDRMIGVCFGHIVPARRGKHLAIPYGPVFDMGHGTSDMGQLWKLLIDSLKEAAIQHGCSFIRLSPFWPEAVPFPMSHVTYSSPMHLLAEHIWYLPLRTPDPWTTGSDGAARSEEEIFMALRKTTRNLVRRAEKEGVTVAASDDPVRDLPLFIALHDETRKRHKFVPYTNAFFRAQAERFHAKKSCALYLARYQGHVIAASMHIHAFGETSYHHGASTSLYGNVPASYLLQWTAIQDALKRGDRVYNFWGIAPQDLDGRTDPRHPFAGVTTFKTGFGGQLLNLMHCRDVPLDGRYRFTRLFENLRKWRRGF